MLSMKVEDWLLIVRILLTIVAAGYIYKVWRKFKFGFLLWLLIYIFSGLIIRAMIVFGVNPPGYSYWDDLILTISTLFLVIATRNLDKTSESFT